MSQDFSGLKGAGAAPAFDAGAMTTEEFAAIASMRETIGTLPPSLAPEASHDFFFLRFLRGYQNDRAAATQAYRAMLEYREAFGIEAIHEELIRQKMPWPWDMDQFAPLRQAVGERGLLHMHTRDLQGNLLTHGLVANMMNGIRAAVKQGLEDMYLSLFRYLDEWMLIELSRLSVEAGHLIGEHQVVDVDGVGMWSFTGALDLLKKFGEGSKHYPERLVHIDDINNSRLAMLIWPLIAPFIPKHTAAKLRVSGRAYQPTLLSQIEATELPVVMGGTSTSERWSYLVDVVGGAMSEA